MTFKFTAAVLVFDVKQGVAHEEKQHIEGDDEDNVESLGGHGQKNLQFVKDIKAVDGVTTFDYKGFDASTTTPEELFEPDSGILGIIKADKLPKLTTMLRKMCRGMTNKNCAKNDFFILVGGAMETNAATQLVSCQK